MVEENFRMSEEKHDPSKALHSQNSSKHLRNVGSLGSAEQGFYATDNSKSPDSRRPIILP
jgi:hypothetical protein